MDLMRERLATCNLCSLRLCACLKDAAGNEAESDHPRYYVVLSYALTWYVTDYSILCYNTCYSISYTEISYNVLCIIVDYSMT